MRGVGVYVYVGEVHGGREGYRRVCACVHWSMGINTGVGVYEYVSTSL